MRCRRLRRRAPRDAGRHWAVATRGALFGAAKARLPPPPKLRFSTRGARLSTRGARLGAAKLRCCAPRSTRGPLLGAAKLRCARWLAAQGAIVDPRSTVRSREAPLLCAAVVDTRSAIGSGEVALGTLLLVAERTVVAAETLTLVGGREIVPAVVVELPFDARVASYVRPAVVGTDQDCCRRRAERAGRSALSRARPLLLKPGRSPLRPRTPPATSPSRSRMLRTNS